MIFKRKLKAPKKTFFSFGPRGQVETYLREEIQQEALVRNLLSFKRFLSVSAIMNAQQLNLSNLARETGISRSTVQGYFSILEDTLIGDLLPACRIKA